MVALLLAGRFYVSFRYTIKRGRRLMSSAPAACPADRMLVRKRGAQRLSAFLSRLLALIHHRVHADEPVNHPAVAGDGDGHSSLLKLLAVGFALVAQRV